ncbi:transcription initiation factor TFIID subunit 11 [Irineochytrium annulatum]|nr:transcription initiation factor TFIID subunit 11 [Irineochytrium annulatum]
MIPESFAQPAAPPVLPPPPVQAPPPEPAATEEDEDEKSEEEADEEEENDFVLKPRSEEEREAMKALIDSLSEEQLHRFEAFRRSKLPKPVVKKVRLHTHTRVKQYQMLQAIMGPTVAASVVIVAAGCGKLFIGDMVGKALEVMGEWGDTGAIRPEHLREAHFRIQKEQAVMAPLR